MHIVRSYERGGWVLLFISRFDGLLAAAAESPAFRCCCGEGEDLQCLSTRAGASAVSASVRGATSAGLASAGAARGLCNHPYRCGRAPGGVVPARPSLCPAGRRVLLPTCVAPVRAKSGSRVQAGSRECELSEMRRRPCESARAREVCGLLESDLELARSVQ